MKHNLIAIVPARSGSKGLKNKNIKPLCGEPLIHWTIDFILKSNLFSRCVVSTDCPNYRDISLQSGAEVPFLRSLELSSDHASSSDVILDVFNQLNSSFSPNDFFVLFEPTSPIRFKNDLDTILNLLSSTNRVVSISEAKSAHSLYQYNLSSDSRLQPVSSAPSSTARRQDMSQSYYLNGSFYASPILNFISNPSFITDTTVGCITNFWSTFEIDYLDDFLLCELIMSKFLSSPNSSSLLQ